MTDLSGMEGLAAYAIKHGIMPFIAWYPDGRLLTANPLFYKMTGYSSGEASAMRWPDDFTSEVLGECIALYMKDPAPRERFGQCEGNIIGKDRSQVMVSVFLHTYQPGPAGERLYFAYVVDISGRTQEEKWLYLTQYAMDHFTDPSLWTDEDGHIVYANDAACQSLGYTRDRLLTMRIWQIDMLETPENYKKRWEYARAAGHFRFDALNLSEDGNKSLMEVHASYIRYGDAERLISFAHDITERRRAEAALAESEEKFRVLADNSMAGIFLVQENRYVYANPAASKMLGYSIDELLRMNFWELVHPEFKEEIKAFATKMLHDKAIPGRFEFKFVKKDGSDGWCDATIAPLRYRGKPAGVVTAMDVTERKRAELSLAESEEKFRVLSELSPTAIFLYQGEKLVYANPAAVAFTGYSMGELLSKNFWEMVHPEYEELVKTYGMARQKGEPVPATYEVKYIAKSGEARWAEFAAGFIEYKGMPAGIVSAVDTTDRKRSEIALQESKAQAELYVDLMGHDINNMNQAAMGFLELACEKVRTKGSLSNEDLDLLVSAIGSLRNSSGLIDSVRKLQRERRGGMRPHVIDIRQVLAEVKDQYSSIPGRDVVIYYTDPCPCNVLANELLRDVFSNIIGNAIKHSRGTIAINVRLSVELRHDTDFCRVDIEDTGPGIPDDRKKAIFERAGADRARLTGKGLGLYLVKTLVDDYHGKVWVEDRVPGDYRKGARFVVLLPTAVKPGDDAAEGADVCNQ